jgi:TrmH family RNA methyltransferase
MLESVGTLGMLRVGAVGAGGAAPENVDMRPATAIVLGNEAHGFETSLPLDARVTIPMAAGESLNVAMAGTALLFEAARQRRCPS